MKKRSKKKKNYKSHLHNYYNQLYDFDLEYNMSICGIDEAGRGCLAGDVYAAAVILNNERIEGLNDSKRLTAEKREELYLQITESCVAYGVGIATVEEINQTNILAAALLAMSRAYNELKAIAVPDIILVDGNQLPPIDVTPPTQMDCVVSGDSLSAAVAAASIIAKVSRDRYMLELHQKYPEWNFAQHKGYATKLHRELIAKHGVCPIHRELFQKKL